MLMKCQAYITVWALRGDTTSSAFYKRGEATSILKQNNFQRRRKNITSFEILEIDDNLNGIINEIE